MPKHAWYAVAIAVALLIAAVLWWLARESAVSFGKVYAYDTGTGQLYATNETIPPMTAPSGPTAGVNVQALIFDGDSKPTAVYLMTYTPEARASLDKTGQITAEVVAGTLVRRPADAEWTPNNSPAGRAIRERATELAAGRTWRVAIP